MMASSALPGLDGAPWPSRRSGTAASSCRERPRGRPCRSWRPARPGRRSCCAGPVSAFAISRTPPALWPVTVLSAGCFARWTSAVNRPASGEKPRKIRDLRRSAARARCGDQILLAALRACYSNVRKFWRSRDLTMASFNTVAGCVLASALFAMVVGKVSNAVVHPHKLEKPALAVVDEAPTTETAAAAPARGAAADRSQARRRQCRGRQGDLHEAVLHLPHHRQGRRRTRSARTSGASSAARRRATRASATPRPCRPRAATGPTKTSTT